MTAAARAASREAAMARGCDGARCGQTLVRAHARGYALRVSRLRGLGGAVPVHVHTTSAPLGAPSVGSVSLSSPKAALPTARARARCATGSSSWGCCGRTSRGPSTASWSTSCAAASR
eukprot:3209034-Prymnesium_polylepis.2